MSVPSSIAADENIVNASVHMSRYLASNVLASLFM